MLAISDQYPVSKVHGANMGQIWDRQDPGGPHFGPMNFAILVPSEHCIHNIPLYLPKCVYKYVNH